MASQNVGDELSPFLLEVPGLEEAAEREEKEAQRGSYGFVFKVTVGGVRNIAKKLHSAFTGHSRVSARERESITARFRNECIILSKLRHPNIVQFVGVHFGPKGLTLIMESLRSDLDDFLSDNPQVPLSLKLSMLRDVSYGLVYLHDERTPAIIHRDLTARNILITDNCHTKIADLGMAKIVTLQQQIAQSHTQAPGQAFYMPPEALKERAECTPKLDIFSFGHLTLFTIIQDYPKVYNVTMTMDVQKNGISERLKRQRSLDLVGSDHCLYPIITECLYDRPEQRPATRDLNSRLIQLSTQHPVSARQVMPYMGEEMARMSEELKDLQKSLEMKTAEVEGLKEENEMMMQEIRELQSKASNSEVNKLTHKLEEMQLRNEKAKECRRESDAKCDELREERDMFRMEMNRIRELNEERKQRHKTHLERERQQHFTALLQKIEAEKQSMQSRIAYLEEESQNNEKLREVTASMKRDLDAKLHDASHALEQKLQAAEKQREHYFRQWQQEERKLEEQLAVTARATDELSVVSQERTYHKVQADNLRVKFQEEKKRVRHLEQEMQKMEEGHREEVDYIKAQCEGKLIDQDRLMVPLQRELEQLRSKTYNESDTYRRMEEEKKEMKMTIETLEEKNHTLMDDFTVTRELLIQHQIPLPKRDAQRRVAETGHRVDYEVQQYSHHDFPSSDKSFHRLNDYDACRTAYSTNIQQHGRPGGDAQQQLMQPEKCRTSTDPRALQLQHKGGPGQPATSTTNRGQEQYSGSPPMRAGAHQQGGGGAPNYDPRLQSQHAGQRLPQQQQGQLRQGETYQHSPANQHYQQPMAPTSVSSRDPPARGGMPQAAVNDQPLNPSGPKENGLIKGFDADIKQAIANLQQGPSLEPIIDSDEEAWPFDSNLICPMCKKQFRIGQIQYYKQHVDKCKGT